MLCDRFIDSSLAYQGFARGLGIEEVYSINKFAIDNQMPVATFYFDINPEIGLERINKNKGREINRIDLESLEFHRKVREGYKILSRKYSDRIIEIDASQPLQTVFESVASSMTKVLQQNL